MQSKNDQFLLFAGSSHPLLAQEIASDLGVELGKRDLHCFPDGEISLRLLEVVRGRDVFVLQSVALNPNYYLMELLIFIDACKRSSARSINVVIPYFGYSRQDRRDKPHVPITAKLVANLLVAAGATRLIAMDLHAGQLEGFFDIPVDHLAGRVILAESVRALGLDSLVVVAPDIGSGKLARDYSHSLNVDYVIVDKLRSSATEVKAVTFIGDVAGKNVLLADDMCSTGGTLVSAAKACREKGAERIFGVITHGLFVGESLKRIEDSPIEALFVSNTVPFNDQLAKMDKLRLVSVAPLFSQAIRCFLSKESLSSLFCDVKSVAMPSP